MIAAIPTTAARYPDALVTPPVVYRPGPSQVKRVLCLLALRKYGLWNQFVTQHWPGANLPGGQTQIRWLEEHFLQNGLLAQYKHAFPRIIQALIP